MASNAHKKIELVEPKLSMKLEEFFKWLGTECLNDKGTKYRRPEFLWRNEYRNYYQDLVVEQIKHVDTVDYDGIPREYWQVTFMLSPYPNRLEYPKLWDMMNIAVYRQEHTSVHPYPFNTEEHLKNLPVELWMREGPDAFVKVKISPKPERFPDPPHGFKFLIEYDK